LNDKTSQLTKTQLRFTNRCTEQNKDDNMTSYIEFGRFIMCCVILLDVFCGVWFC